MKTLLLASNRKEVSSLHTRTPWRLSPLLLLILLLCATSIAAAQSKRGGGPDIRAALPTPDQIRGFKKTLHSNYFPGHAEISVQRLEGLILTITVVTSATEAEMRKHCRNKTFTQIGFMSSGSPSGATGVAWLLWT
jgi:predicted small secreted protein